MSSIAYSVVDAFTATPFKGNPAAVIVLDPNNPLATTALQSIASEFNLSNTAFITPIDVTEGRFSLRWFTPSAEVVLCGHATLASASVLFSAHTILPENESIRFDTLSGVLTAQYLPDGRIELEFPAGQVVAVDEPLREKVGEVLRHASKVSPELNICFVGSGEGGSFGNYMLIEIDGIDLEKAAIKPDSFMVLSPQHKIIMVTQVGRNGNETFASRVFGPAAGVPEDPVTGSTHCMLGPYWAKKLQIQGTTELAGRQVSARSGVVGVIWDREKGTCRLRGNATLVAKGELYLPK